MNKLLAKLMACVLALVISAALVVMSSYAWLTMSGAPEVDGIQVHIGGKNTVLIAADMTIQNSDGTISHYPGAFGESLDFSHYESYDYLENLAGLLPVSTVDGENWVLPDFYDLNDSQVQSGLAVNGQIKEYRDFIVDNDLSFANLTELPTAYKGHYIYLDFWVVSPGANYQLRVSNGDGLGDDGSYVIALPSPQRQDDRFVLAESNHMVSAAMRVGFLVNGDTAADHNLQDYISSDAYVNRYRRLLGQYAGAGQTTQGNNRFTIYEPNGNLHPEDTGNQDYYITQPLAVYNGMISPANISDRLTVQLQNRWKQAAGSDQTLLQQQFITAITGKDLSTETELSLLRYFYKERLQGLVAPYVQKGRFVPNTEALYNAVRYGKVSAESETLRLTSGATEDVYITTLEKDVPQRIRMFIWLEGQDMDCGNYSDLSGLSVNLELAGSNQY